MKLQRSAPLSETGRPESSSFYLPEKETPFSLPVHLKALFQLTKPKIMLLVLITGMTTLILEGRLVAYPLQFVLFLVGLYMTGGAANAFNQYFERAVDARMERTRNRRPLPLGLISPSEAVIFSSALGLAGVILLGAVFNLLTAALAAGTMLFYSLVYTLWLKPNTPYNIVIGGIAGAMAPVGAWAAATGGMALTPWILFLIVFLWTPPHFWSLALYFRSDYERSRLPMMPIIKGDRATLQMIFYYAIAVVVASLAYIPIGGKWIYAAAALGLGAAFVHKVLIARQKMDRRSNWALFGFSIFYLFGLFAAMVLDKVLLR
jgi:protoheme IX farnesyltransferase